MQEVTNPEIAQVLKQLQEDIHLRNLSRYTEYEYLSQAQRFLEYSNCSICELSEEHICSYLKYLLYEKNLSPETINVYNSCVKFLFDVTLKRNINIRLIPRMRKRYKLPQILNREEISLLFEACTNLKHKSILMLAYGSGLRVSEITNLKITDIQSKTMRVFVNLGKGKKDRYTILSESCLLVLREYYKKYRPKDWLFEGMHLNNPISKRTAQSAFNKALEKSGIQKNVSIHSLRHSFATHLLEDGANLVEIKMLLGHTFIQSSSYYIHLANCTENIKSPLDSIASLDKGGLKNA